MGPFLICRVSNVWGKKRKKEKHTDELPAHLQQEKDSGVSRQVGPEGSTREALQSYSSLVLTSRGCIQFWTLCSFCLHVFK